METQTPSKKALWTGWIISVLCILFLLLDAVMKVIKSASSMEGSSKLGIPLDAVQGIGITLLICTIIYAIPRTAIWGAVLITGYLGGAIAVMVCAKAPFYFPLIFGVLVWLGVYLPDEKLKALVKKKLCHPERSEGSARRASSLCISANRSFTAFRMTS